MSQYIDILIIKGDWEGGNHPNYPKVLSVNPALEKPFAVSEGWGHGLGGGAFTLRSLVEKGFVGIFDRVESRDVYEKLMTAYQENMDDRKLAEELLAGSNSKRDA